VSNASEPPRLKSATLQLTLACNQACAYCYQVASGRSLRMSRAVATAALRLLLERAPPRLTIELSGGEPLREPALLRWVIESGDAARPPTCTLSWSVTTNGTLLGDGLLAFFVARGVSLRLSHDGVPAALARRSAASWAVLDRLLGRMAAIAPAYLGSKVTIALAVTGASVPHLAEGIRYLVEKGARIIGLYPLLADPSWREGTAAELRSQLQEVVAICVEAFERSGTVPVSELLAPAPRRTNRAGRPVLCRAPLCEGIVVDPAGALWACPLFEPTLGPLPPLAAAVARRLCLGHVSEPGLAERLERAAAASASLRIFTDHAAKRSPRGRCVECECLDSCTVCPGSICHLPANRDPGAVPAHVCDLNRALHAARDDLRRRLGATEDSLVAAVSASGLATELIAALGAPRSSV
jgi:sulfatase maturation enzyme AslB (radical SAM superfamily)